MQHTQGATGDRAPVIEIDGLTKVFHDFWRRPRVRAVDGLTLAVRPGEVFGLLGPNGSGKSTTIKILLGLLYPTQGRVRVLGRSPRDVQTKARIGYLPEESYLYPFLTPAETLDFYGRLFGLAGRERRQRTDELLEMVGLQHARRRAVGEFSKGMARRVGLAQALINDPDLIVLDEPTAGLDPIGCRQMKDLILTLARRGKTVLLSSHLLADVEDVCDRVAILYSGRIRAEGPIGELLVEKDRCRLTLPGATPDQIQTILARARELCAQEPELDHPRKNLETFFLGVVEQARRTDTGGPSGAAEGRAVARYLSGPPAATPTADGEGAAPRASVDERLQRLVRQDPPEPGDHA